MTRPPSRRALLQAFAASSVAWAAPTGADWIKQAGLELHTVRDLIAKDMEATLARVAEIGFREVEPTTYGNLEPKQFRALLDKYKLTAPSTHVFAQAGPDLEKQLEGQQIMGHKYTEIRNAPGPRAAAAAAPAAPRPSGVRPQPPAMSEDAVKRSAAQLNEHGKLARKYGMKILVHNHTQEYEYVMGSKTLRPFDIQLAETDPALVAMQLDIGWASVAGQNIVEMFRKNPGRYELWHVKDATGLKNIDQSLSPNQRRGATKLVPVGQGDVDYRAIFAKADLAGMKHYCIEQDNAVESSDSVAVARANFEGLRKLLAS